jgi:DNA-binding transcriptional ArsR family regulator
VTALSRLVVGSAFLLVLLAPLGAAQAPDRVQVVHELGLAASGRIEGTCDTTHLRLAAPAGTRLTLHSTGGAWTHTRMDANRTTFAAPGQPVASVTHGQALRQTRAAVPEGDLLIELGTRARIEAYPSADTFTSTLVTDRLHVGPVVGPVRTLTLFESTPWPPPWDVAPAHRGAHGPNRAIEAGSGTARIRGDLTIYLEDAAVTLPNGSRLHVGPRYAANHTLATPAGADSTHAIQTWALLRLTAATFETGASQARLLCHGLAARLDGSVHAYGARGRVEVHGRAVDFERRVLTLVGNLTWTETPTPQGVEAHASGTIRSANLDFGTSLHHDRTPDLARVGLWTAAAAVLGAAAWCLKALLAGFTRLDEHAVLGLPSRRQVLDAVRARPNVRLGELSRLTGLGRSEVLYHARILERQGLLRSHKVRARRCFVARETVAIHGAASTTPTTDVVARVDPIVGEVVRRVPESGIRLSVLLRAVADASGISRVGAWKAVARAEAFGFVARRRHGASVWVAPQPRLIL